MLQNFKNLNLLVVERNSGENLASMLAVVHAMLLNFPGDAHTDGDLAEEEEKSRGDAHPGNNGKDKDGVGTEHGAVATVKDTSALRGTGSVVSRGVHVLGSEKSGGDDAPDAAETVHRNGADNVINLELLQEGNANKWLLLAVTCRSHVFR